MRQLYVYADFDWLDKPQLVGTLTCDTIRGSEKYGFEFDKTWLGNFGNIILSPDINPYPGMQYAQPGRGIFACFSDALPDRWGRTLLKRREQIAAKEENRSVRILTSWDFLGGIDDFSRMGGFRFAETPGGPFINTDDSFKIPPLTSVRQLMHAANEIELSEEKHVLPADKWIQQLIYPGTSLGGARPKATVLNEDNTPAVAKFPSRKDDYDVGMWEHFAHIMAKKCGINAAETGVIEGEKYHILLSRRFDRTADGKRIHFASAMTMLGLVDGDNASTGHGYLDIVDFIIKQCRDVKENLEELYRRVAFNIVIGNSDDHFRNHSFLLTPQGWTLAPAYDLNPTLSQNQSLLINKYTDESSLAILRESAADYMLMSAIADRIIKEVSDGMQSWKTVALRLGLPQRDIDYFADRFSTPPV